MSPFTPDTSAIIRRTKDEYKDIYDAMTWLTPEKAKEASDLRESLMRHILMHPAKAASQMFSNTKLYLHGISKGCQHCGNGDWSCLFINGICNARCFYCPSAQTQKGPPVTNTLEFKNPADFADYVRVFGIKGVSFSGGEPFITFDRVVSFLKTLRSRISHPLYIWMYTNGLLVTEDKLKILKDEGLDEIRFDISANEYSLDALKKAVPTIPCVTVEIPAIPEDLELTRPLLKTLRDEGVSHLNLHQLRCTPFNAPKLIARRYTFVHGQKVTVLETELAALELIRFAMDEGIRLPINYCSFAFRGQFQKAAALKRNASFIKSAHEDITKTGHIRTLSLLGEEKKIRKMHDALVAKGVDPNLWRTSKGFDQLFFNSQLFSQMDFNGLHVKAAYSSTTLKPSVSFRHPFKEVNLNRKRKVVIERHTEEPGILLEGQEIECFKHKWICPEPPRLDEKNLQYDLKSLPDRISLFEDFTQGPAPYFTTDQ